MITQSNLDSNTLSRDFKGIWVPRELWESEIKKKDIYLIINHLYFSDPLPRRVWQLLQSMQWADFSKECGFVFSKNFKQMLSLGGSHV